MACGDINWWREPDLVGLLERHGQAEHLVVQFDFLVQIQRDGRAEFSIPRSSKRRNGKTGYADVVSVASRQVWEIKPEHLEKQALSEAAWYVTNAVRECGPEWKPGVDFVATNRYGTPGVVYRIEGNGNRADLFAKQGPAGSILYYWEINGKRDPELQRSFAWALRLGVVRDYFGSEQTMESLPGTKPPTNIPPIKFRELSLAPSDCVSELKLFVGPLVRSMQTTCAARVAENGAVAILFEASMFQSIVGRRIVAHQKQSMEVRAVDPSVRLYRETLAILTGAAAANGLIGLALGIGTPVYLAITSMVELVGGVLMFVCTEASAAASTVLPPGGLLGSLMAGLNAAIRAAVAPGAAFVVVAVPRASMADPDTPVSLDVSLAKFRVLSPHDAARARIGDSFYLDGAEWRMAGAASPKPD